MKHAIGTLMSALLVLTFQSATAKTSTHQRHVVRKKVVSKKKIVEDSCFVGPGGFVICPAMKVLENPLMIDPDKIK